MFFDTRAVAGRPDGGTVDADGCYWMAGVGGWQIYRITPEGKLDRTIDVPVEKPTKPMFGGPDLDTLYVTSLSLGLTRRAPRPQPEAGSLFAITGLGVQGVPQVAVRRISDEDHRLAQLHDPRPRPPAGACRHSIPTKASPVGASATTTAPTARCRRCWTTSYLQIEGEDPRRIERIMLKLLQQSRFPPGALGLAAMSAIDHALWDISAKAVGVPVYMLLGGHVRDRVRVYLGVYSAPRSGRDRATIAAAMQRALGAYRVQALALPQRHPRRALAQGAEGHRRLGGGADNHLCPDYEFAFDAHAKLSSPGRPSSSATCSASSTRCSTKSRCGRRISRPGGGSRRSCSVPLATGESLYSRYEFLRLLQCGGADIVQPDICVVGGLLEMRKIAALAEAFYVTVAPHNPMGPLATAVNVHFSAACPNFKILEYRLPTGAAYHSDGMAGAAEAAAYVTDPYLPRDGYLELRPTGPAGGSRSTRTI